MLLLKWWTYLRQLATFEFGQNLPLTFYVLRNWSLIIIPFGHSTQNYTVQLILYTMPDFCRLESSHSLGRGKRLLMVVV